MQIEILSLSSSLYSAYYRLVQQTKWGNPMLPETYNDTLWGDIVLQGGKVVGGWIGTLRGSHPLTRWLTKSVYFDSYPVFAANDMEQEYSEVLVRRIRQHAQKEHIVMLNLTHWVRGNSLPIGMEPQTEATFVTDLHLSEDELWHQVESKQRNCIRKGEKCGVETLVLQEEQALAYLNDFQRLRQKTQAHAIRNNAQASMLLKSDRYFADILRQKSAILYVGKIESQVAAVALMLQSGQTVYYYSGGSDYLLNKKYSCSAYLLWKAVCDCKNRGIAFFDMGGVPVQPDESHPAYGVYRFKKSFGGEYQEFHGGRIVIAPVKYRMLNFLLSQRTLLRLFSKKM